MKYRQGFTFIFGLILMVILIALFSYTLEAIVIKLLWNFLIAKAFHLALLNWVQAYVIAIVLSTLSFLFTTVSRKE